MSGIGIYLSLAVTFSLFSFCVHTSRIQPLSSTPEVTSLLGISLYPIDLPINVFDTYIRNLEKATRCYVECMRVSGNNDMLVATSHWFYMTLRRMEREKEAAALLLPISEKMDIIENDAYHQLLLFYKGKIAESNLFKEGEDALQNTTLAYGVANWHCYNGNKEKGSQLLKSILTSDYWPAFGYIAAEADVVDNRCR